MRDYAADDRVVLTLDAGGTNLVFGAMAGNEAVVEPVTLPTHADDLEVSLRTIVEGFDRVRAAAPRPPVAISFAFPGPCDYAHGIVVAPPNLTAYRNVALGPMLEDRFGLPVFINNDGDLFAVGEAAAGLLPHVNGLLVQAGSPKRYQNLVGFTLGTGFGCGIVHKGALFTGDNSLGGEVWLLRNKLAPETNVEEGVSIRAVRRFYAAFAGVAITDAPEPRVIAEIARGGSPGDVDAARRAYAQLGEVAGDAISFVTTLIDGLIVIGGGIAASHRLFLPALVREMNGQYYTPAGEPFRRLVQKVFDLEDAEQLQVFLRGQPVDLAVPGSGRTVSFDALQRVGVGISRLGTSHAVAIGAYAHALGQLGRGDTD
jgi:glucokinase